MFSIRLIKFVFLLFAVVWFVCSSTFCMTNGETKIQYGPDPEYISGIYFRQIVQFSNLKENDYGNGLIITSDYNFYDQDVSIVLEVGFIVINGGIRLRSSFAKAKTVQGSSYANCTPQNSVCIGNFTFDTDLLYHYDLYFDYPRIDINVTLTPRYNLTGLGVETSETERFASYIFECEPFKCIKGIVPKEIRLTLNPNADCNNLTPTSFLIHRLRKYNRNPQISPSDYTYINYTTSKQTYLNCESVGSFSYIYGNHSDLSVTTFNLSRRGYN